MITSAGLLLFCLASIPNPPLVQVGPDLDKLQRTLTQDLPPIHIPGAIPGVVMAYGDRASVLAVAKIGGTTQAAVVGAEYGKGRVAAYGHGSLFQHNLSLPLNKRLFGWLNPSNAIVGVVGFGPTSQTADMTSYSVGDLARAIRECKTLVVQNNSLDDAGIASLQRYVSTGGSLLVIDTPWGWKQLNPGKSIRGDHPAQRLLEPMGIGFADGLLDKNRNDDLVLLAPSREHHAKEALEIYQSTAEVSKESASILATTMIAAVSDTYVASPFGRLVRSAVAKTGRELYPQKGKPIGTEQFRARVSGALFDQSWRSLPPSEVTAHPAAADFPGLVGESEPRNRVNITIGGGKREWWSTGRYAGPGELVTIKTSGGSDSNRLKLRIGGHRDELWHKDSWERFPSIDLEVPIKNGTAQASNPFGGMVYVVSSGELPPVSVELVGSVAAPVFFKGKTTTEEWKKLRALNVPWGEIVGDQSAISVPSSSLKDLDDPTAVADYWDEMVRQAEIFYAVKPGTTEHRYQVDRQISAGYMHSGYPIMTWEDVAKRFVDIKILRGNSGNPNWGFYHELGHNYQQPSWTWSGWGEVTNNLFSVFGCEHFNGGLRGHEAMAPDKVAKRIADVLANPGSAKFYERDPWYGLTFWMQIKDEFGFAPINKLFTRYANMAPGARPKSDSDKRSSFVVEMSTILGRDLTRYCQMWGVEFSDEAKRAASKYPEWLPKWPRS